MTIQNLSEEAKELLAKLSPQEKEVIWGLVAAPPSRRARVAARRELTAYLATRLEEFSYLERVIYYRDLLNLVIKTSDVLMNDDNKLLDLLGEVVWLNCNESDRPLAIMMAIKRLNSTLTFKDSDSEQANSNGTDFNLKTVDFETAELEVGRGDEEESQEFVEYEDDLDEDTPAKEFFDILSEDSDDDLPL